MLLNQLMSQVTAVDDKPYIEDLFQSTLYSGTGSTRTLTTGIDLTGGGMIWLKSRSAATDHAIYDTVRGATYDLASNLTTAQTTQATGVTGFGATGFSMGALAKINTSAATYAAWTFKKAAKFFDVVQFTAGSSTNRRISHSLGCVPGMIVVRSTSGTSSGWMVYHIARGRQEYGYLHLTSSFGTYSNVWGTSDPTTTDFGVSEPAAGFGVGTQCIAYLFAHDDSADGVVQCGSFVGEGSGRATVNLGWEPQYVMTKRSSETGSWYICDASRGMTVNDTSNTDAVSLADSSAAESITSCVDPSPTGFIANAWSGRTYIYLAIRRGPMRTPTDGTKVYNAIARTGTGAAATVTGVGFAPDVVIGRQRDLALATEYVVDRLRGTLKYLKPTGTGAEVSTTTGYNLKSLDSDGISLGTMYDYQINSSGGLDIHWIFRRAPGFFDQVCYTGTGVARTIAHGLKSVPGMIWVKSRSGTAHWVVYHKSTGAQYYTILNLTDAASGPLIDFWNYTEPTASLFSLGNHTFVNGNAATYTAYLFGDSAGLCKAFSYTGNGSNQDIALGFAPRFVLIKRTNAVGDWKIFDSTRGIVSGNDPVLSLNTTASEVTTTDPIDPIANGFNITQEATNNLNVTSATYIGWACI